MKKIALAIVAVIALSGCGAQENDPRLDGAEDLGSRENHSVVTVQYDGRDLDCITWSGSHGEAGMTCDFVKYHADDSEFE